MKCIVKDPAQAALVDQDLRRLGQAERLNKAQVMHRTEDSRTRFGQLLKRQLAALDEHLVAAVRVMSPEAGLFYIAVYIRWKELLAFCKTNHRHRWEQGL